MLISQQEFKVGLLLTLEVNRGKLPSTIKDAERFRELIKSGIPFAAISSQLQDHPKSTLLRSQLPLLESDQIHRETGSSIDSAALEGLRKELTIARMEVKAARALINEDAINKLDKIVKTAKTKAIKIPVSTSLSSSQEESLKRLADEFLFMEHARAMNVFVEMELKPDSDDFILDCSNIYFQNLLSLYRSVMKDISPRAFLATFSDRIQSIASLADKPTKRVLDFLVSVHPKTSAGLLLGLFKGYCSLMIESDQKVQLQVKMHPSSLWDAIPSINQAAVGAASSAYKSPVWAFEEMAFRLVQLYGKGACLLDATAYLMRLLLSQPAASSDLIHLLSRLLSLFSPWIPNKVRPDIAALWSVLFNDQELDMDVISIESALYLSQILMQYPVNDLLPVA